MFIEVVVVFFFFFFFFFYVFTKGKRNGRKEFELRKILGVLPVGFLDVFLVLCKT
jgi:hypothetical protein